MKKFSDEGNQIHNFFFSSGSGTVINYGSGSDFLTSYGSGSTSQKVTVPTVPVPQRYFKVPRRPSHHCTDQVYIPEQYSRNRQEHPAAAAPLAGSSTACPRSWSATSPRPSCSTEARQLKGTVRPDWISKGLLPLDSPFKGHQPLYVFNFLFLILNI
jgi:hypothetical protein